MTISMIFLLTGRDAAIKLELIANNMESGLPFNAALISRYKFT